MLSPPLPNTWNSPPLCLSIALTSDHGTISVGLHHSWRRIPSPSIVIVDGQLKQRNTTSAEAAIRIHISSRLTLAIMPAAPRGTAWSVRPSLCRSTPGTFLLHFSRQQVGLLGCYTDFENLAKLSPSHRINTFPFANGHGGCKGGKNCLSYWQQRRSHMVTPRSHTPTRAGVTCHAISRCEASSFPRWFLDAAG